MVVWVLMDIKHDPLKALTNVTIYGIIYEHKGVVIMRIELKKQAEKYLEKCNRDDYNKISDALDDLKILRGDIIKLKGRKDEYRVKIPPFRIIFTYDKIIKVIVVTRIDTRGDAYKKG